ncbi:response regulator transcription factor [Janibacter terrae]|uniref:Response regulator transcription factor n=1 Tax=Janibacter terrae TaxID=103817 RepID=A0ABZ2FF15_9MICO|nr:response regulator transcription factor [Janibacter terrae]MBA4085600.1 DNA-binding response regulator [Kytococcus sp.]HBO54075.1 DNA-binding response regulator [Janibacter terrae]
MVATTVFLLDDHEVVRRGLRELLETTSDISVIGESASASEATRRIPALRPDVAIFDARLPDGSGIDACREVRSVDPGIKGLILTSYDDGQALAAAVLAGASGYLLKDIKGNGLIDAIRRVAAGENLLDDERADELRRKWSPPTPPDALLSRLTPQEQLILEHVAEGLTNRQIGEVMFLAEKTVKNYVTSILSKLGFQRRTQAAIYAVENRASGGPR